MELNWEEISRKISSAADYTVKQTERLTAMAKVEYKLANAKNKLNLLYQNLGKIKFSEMAGEQIDAAAYDTVYEKIGDVLLTIDQLENELASLRRYRLCVACGARIANDVVYCPKCGTKQDPEKSETLALSEAEMTGEAEDHTEAE